ncbi:centromere protein Cenp-K [Zychaea mexicana]|uniref:centromere protein Cenp-K n=1 Tax=Zychaea mexicana TaxID=64656 RepID=UPI0022FE8667|nr:centromere protein Cenp-K [Zychaea mexicana]KAI9493421.1 centromere protein Cenp-K [Zychaea mexicana]
MWIEEKLKEIIAQAARDFDQIIAEERKIESSEDGTARGSHLDQILFDQKNEREQLWARLHELEDTFATSGSRKLFVLKVGAQVKYLSTLKVEQQELGKDLKEQIESVREIRRPKDETVNELQFKERLHSTVEQLHEALKTVDQELTDTTEALRREQTVLSECQQITEVLQQRVEEARQPEAMQRASIEAHETLNRLRDKHRTIMGELINFVNEHFPPHPVDGAPEMIDEGDEVDTCELAFLLEDLMNLAVLKPHDPYLTLIEGTYWSPYIETIIKAGIAVRDPENSSRIRLVDFRV